MKPSRILVIDDSVSATRIVKFSLEKTGHYEVRELNDPTGALAVAREFKPDLILLDVYMPGVEGGEVAFQIQSDKEFERTPIVFLTSLISEKEAEGNGVLVGGFHVVAKPPRVERLIACIESTLATARSGEELCTEREC